MFALGLPASLASAIEVDVLIIGAGYTGLSTALHGREAGLDLCVLEAHTPGCGASGTNAGQWLPGWVGRSPSQVVAQFGKAQGGRLNAFNVEAARLVPALVRQHGIAADLASSGVLQVAASTHGLKRLQVLAQEWHDQGASVTALDRRRLRDHVLTDHYSGGMLFHDAGNLNPLAYARGLASAVVKAGGRIYCDTPVLDLERAENEWVARTPAGEVRARRVVIAIDAFADPELWPRLGETFWPLRIPMLRSPILAHRGSDFLPRATPFAEMRPGGLLFGGMLDRAGRWIASAAPYFWCTDRDTLGAWSLKRFRKIFPQVEPFRWETLWWGTVGISRDTLPRVYALAEGAWGINGYSGGGIALATGLGGAMARMLAAGDVRVSSP
jgi:glycine/D-amino acid oxidase-like deaminating enzyme